MMNERFMKWRERGKVVRVYGPTRGHSSWPRVTSGVVEGLEKIGALASFCATDDIGHNLNDSFRPGFDSPVGIHIGPPSTAGVMKGRGAHVHRLAMIAVNSSWAPRNAMAALEGGRNAAVTGYLAPSRWATEVLSGHTELPVLLFQHGVSDEFLEDDTRNRAAVAPSHPYPKRFRVLHMASTHNERKGTAKLIEAWARFIAELGGAGRRRATVAAKLTLVCDGPRSFFQDALDDAVKRSNVSCSRITESISLEPRKDLSINHMRDLYRTHSVVCQPSRSEGFGMVPLEARLSGVPVIMTTGTGHDDHIPWSSDEYRRDRDLKGRCGGVGSYGIVLVKNSGSSAIDDGPGALAPDFTVANLTQSLHVARENIDYLTESAITASGLPGGGKRWQWETVCRLFMSEMESAGMLGK